MAYAHVFHEQTYWKQLQELARVNPVIRGVLDIRDRAEISDLELLLRLAVGLGSENENLKRIALESAQMRMPQPLIVPSAAINLKDILSNSLTSYAKFTADVSIPVHGTSESSAEKKG